MEITMKRAAPMCLCYSHARERGRAEKKGGKRKNGQHPPAKENSLSASNQSVPPLHCRLPPPVPGEAESAKEVLLEFIRRQSERKDETRKRERGSCGALRRDG